MGFAHARVIDEFVFFMLPDGAFDVERRLARHRRPTVAPVVAEEIHVLVAKGEPGGIERHGEHALDLGRVVPLVDHDI